jgi:hypothetical protein
VNDRRFEDAVDAALESARRESRESTLPPALRARILAAVRPAAAPEPRGRVIDFVLRAAAVAAAFAAVLLVMPMKLEAAEFDAQPLLDLNDHLATLIADRLPPLDLEATRIPELAGDMAVPLAGVAVALIGCGLWFLRRERRR